MIGRIVTYIEREPWDEKLLRRERYLKAACWCLVAFAAVYFGGALLEILAR